MPLGLYTGPDSYTGNGVTTTFTYTFQIFASTDLRVTIDEVVTVPPTVTGVGSSSGGSITFASAPASGALVVIERVRPYSRSTDYQRNGAFDEQTVDADFDSMEMQIQQVAANIDRAFKPPVSVTTDMVLSQDSWDARASKYLGFNSSGTFGAFSQESAGTLTVSSFAQTILDDADADSVTQTIINGASAETTPAQDDIVLISDVSLTPDNGRKMTLANLMKVINVLDAKAVPLSADRLALYDVTNTKAVRATVAEVLGGAVPNLTDGGDANDTMLIVDGGVAKRKSLGYVRYRDGAYSAAFGSVLFLSVPSQEYISKITLSLDAVSSTGTSPFTVRMSDTTGFYSTGYSGTQMVNTPAVVALSSGFQLLSAAVAAATYTGQIVIERAGSDGKTWVATGIFARSDGTAGMHFVSGRIIIADSMPDGVVLTTNGGVDTFDAGSVQVRYE